MKWHDLFDPLRQRQLERRYVQNLRDVKSVFDEAGLPFFLNCGTLLGAFRDGRAIRRDFRDIDISIRNEDLTPAVGERIRDRLGRLGFSCRADRGFENPRQTRFDRGSNHIDVFHYTRVGPFYFRYWSVFGDVPMIAPARYIERLDEIEYYGSTCRIPAHTEDFLTLFMGKDWRTPMRHGRYASRNVMRRREHASRYEDYMAGRFDEALYLSRGIGWESD